jgi:hypothetical protein
MKAASRYAAVRRTAKRRGFSASRSRVRDEHAIGYGRWTVTDRAGRRVSPKEGWTLEQVEQWIAHPEEATSAPAQAR